MKKFLALTLVILMILGTLASCGKRGDYVPNESGTDEVTDEVLTPDVDGDGNGDEQTNGDENADNGNADGGNTDGGNTDGGNTDGGNTNGGNTDNGNTNNGGSTEPTACTHTGGTATCTKKAVCTTCNQEYGELAAHTGGTATCKDKAICTVCNNAYGELSTRHTGPFTDATCKTEGICSYCNKPDGGGVSVSDHEDELDWVSDASGHKKAYKCCGAAGGSENDCPVSTPHNYGADQICDDCGYNNTCSQHTGDHNCTTCNTFLKHTFSNGKCVTCNISFNGFNVGDSVTFGSYEQDATAGKDPITWTIIDKDSNGNVLILADKILEGYVYNSDYNSTNYQDSEIRNWLINTFVGNAFSADEQKAMLVNVSDTLNAKDKIFLISNAQAEKLDVADRKKVRTAYASTVIDYDWWWLGESSTSEEENIKKYAYAVWSNGNIGNSNYYDPVGQYSTDKGGVVPAMWVSLNGECAAHTYGKDNVCDVCGNTCNHDGVATHATCDKCGIMKHEYTTTGNNTTCSVCGVQFTSKEVGGQVTFGSYEQDATAGKDPIKWTIIDTDENGRVLILADNILDIQKFNSSYVTYENSAVRTWLTTTFVNSAFNDAEKAIMSVNTNDTKNAQDKIFLLSLDYLGYEVENPGNYTVRKLTAYAASNLTTASKNAGDAWWYWLGQESTKKPQNGTNPIFACVVGSNGTINNYEQSDTYLGGVVPAMWIQL